MNTLVESKIVVWTLGGAFAIVSLLFAGKMIILLTTFAGLKMTAFVDWITSGEGMVWIGNFLWDCMKAVGKGLNPFD